MTAAPLVIEEQTMVTEHDDDRERDALERSWRSHRGLIGWLAEVNHTKIAKRYVVTAFIFFVLGGIEAALIRIQLARP